MQIYCLVFGASVLGHLIFHFNEFLFQYCFAAIYKYIQLCSDTHNNQKSSVDGSQYDVQM